jgi:type IV secretory pathway TraG/TraD family ATPase VirD4
MSKVVTGFAAKLLQVRMFVIFLTRLCFLIFLAQLIMIFVFNGFFNPLWSRIKLLVMSGFSTSGKLLFNGEIDYGIMALKNTISLFWYLQHSVINYSFLVWILLPMVLLYMILFDEKSDNSREYIQGRKSISPQELNKIMNKNYKHCLSLGEIYLPRSEEIKQTFIVGKPGSGKTNAFNFIIEKIRTRGQKLIVHDYKGDYVEKFYDPNRGDLIFNPLDIRSLGWCLFNDCDSVMDIELFASSLIPDAPPGADPFWNNAARDVMVGILHYCYANNLRSNKGIWQTCILPNDELYLMLKDTKGGERGAKHIEDTSSKTAASIMSNLMQYVKVFEYMQDMNGQFSIMNWVKNKEQSSTIFISNYSKLQYTLNPMISLFIQAVGSALLSEPDNLEHRIFFCLDEFGQLPGMFTIQSLMTASRSKGGAVFIGVQDIAQIDRIYKREARTSILNSASNRVIFNCKDYDTAKFLSLDIGETEYFERMESQSLAMSNGDRINTSRQRRKEPLVTTENIQSLPDLSAYISIGHYDLTLSKFKYKNIDTVAQAFIQRHNLDLSSVKDITPYFVNENEPIKLRIL